MDKDQAQKIRPDTPLSITDGAPPVIELAGAKARLPGAMDYRIMARVSETLGDEMEDEDVSVLLLYCCLHHTKKQIAKLWQAARNPLELWESVQLWMAGMDAAVMIKAINALGEYQSELSEQIELDGDGDNDPSKKKTT